MARDKHERERTRRMPPFIMVLKETCDEPAWRAMSHGARSLYIALKRRIGKDARNNGKVWISQRDAAHEIGSHHNEIARWFRELQHYGFIVQTTLGYLGVDGKGVSPPWRLSELGYMLEPPTQDYKRWDGTKFRDRPKTESRAGNGAQGVPEMAHTTVREIQHGSSPKRAGNDAHKDDPRCAGNPAHTKLTTTSDASHASSQRSVGGGQR